MTCYAALWFFLSGFSSALALQAVVRRDWLFFLFFFAWAVGALVVVLLGWMGTREEQGLQDGTQQFRNARLRLVRQEDRDA